MDSIHHVLEYILSQGFYVDLQTMRGTLDAGQSNLQQLPQAEKVNWD
jgi:hypothetical protein